MTTRAKAPRVQARTGGRGRAREQAQHLDATTLRARREAAGLTAAELCRRVAALSGTSPAAWQVALAQYEAGAKSPGPGRLAQLDFVLDATASQALTWDLLSALRPEVVGALIERYGLDAVATEIEARAGSLRGLKRRMR